MAKLDAGGTFERLRNRYRLVVMNDDTYEEVVTFRLSRLSVYIMLSTIFVLLVGLTVALIVFTPLKYYIPGYGNVRMDREYRQLLSQFLAQNVFPNDIKTALEQSLHNPAASSCADEQLLRTLRAYDDRPSHLVFVEAVPTGAIFKTHDGKIFGKGEKIRKRFRCEEVKTRKIYLFSPVYEVEQI